MVHYHLPNGEQLATLIGALTLLAVSVALASGDDRATERRRRGRVRRAVRTDPGPPGQGAAAWTPGLRQQRRHPRVRLPGGRRERRLRRRPVPSRGRRSARRPQAVEFRISIPTGLGAAVRSGEIDMVARILTATITRDARRLSVHPSTCRLSSGVKPEVTASSRARAWSMVTMTP